MACADSLCVRIDCDPVYGSELGKLVRRYPSAGSAYTYTQKSLARLSALWWVGLLCSTICSPDDQHSAGENLF